MSERRMISRQIIQSDAFLDMPLSTQCLYFHFILESDDDGVVNNPKRVQRYIGASDDDLKLLIAKRFVLAFESGVIILKHWKIHNWIRKDRYRPSKYQDELSMLMVKENGAYTECQPSDIPNVIPTNTLGKVSIGKYRLGKVSIDKVSIGKDSYHSALDDDDEVEIDEEV